MEIEEEVMAHRGIRAESVGLHGESMDDTKDEYDEYEASLGVLPSTTAANGISEEEGDVVVHGFAVFECVRFGGRKGKGNGRDRTDGHCYSYRRGR